MNEKISTKGIIYTVIAFSTFIGLSIWYHAELDNTAKKILNNHSFTIGSLTKYIPSGSSTRIHFEYCVYGVVYEKIISVGSEFDYCKQISLCKDKKFWVIYHNSNHSDCMIDLSNEVKDQKNKPISLDNFEIPDWKKLW